MSSDNAQPPKPSRSWLFFVCVPLPALGLLAIFALIGGAFTPDRPTPQKFVNQLETNGGVHTGYRRNHAKGACVMGYFEGAGEAAFLAATPLLEHQHFSQVIGRVSLPGGNPHLADDKAPLLSMALQLRDEEGEEWRTAMLSAPVFPVATPAAFLAQLQAAAPDPATGKPNPQKLQAFFATHPETKNFLTWKAQAPKPKSFALTRFNSLNSFNLSNRQGKIKTVRWSFINRANTAEHQPQKASLEGENYLYQDLANRLAEGKVQWNLQFQIAAPEDPVNDATQPWPPERKTVNAGQLVITSMQAEDEGACRDINYDPTVLPTGFAPSADPLLSARSAVYANASRRRWQEQSHRPQAAGTIENYSSAFSPNQNSGVTVTATSEGSHHE